MINSLQLTMVDPLLPPTEEVVNARRNITLKAYLHTYQPYVAQ